MTKEEFEADRKRRRQELAEGLGRVTLVEDPIGQSADPVREFVQGEYARHGVRGPLPQIEGSE